jgi:hypothetical protein
MFIPREGNESYIDDPSPSTISINVHRLTLSFFFFAHLVIVKRVWVLNERGIFWSARHRDLDLDPIPPHLQ